MWIEDSSDDILCSQCGTCLLEPFIRCAECSHPIIHLCLTCFARGLEPPRHQNDHPYIIVKSDFPLYEKTWTANEELTLLKAILDCGYGNWHDISLKVESKNKSECEKHYNEYYIDNPEPPLLEFPFQKQKKRTDPLVYKLCEDPPRPPQGSTLYNMMGGYAAPRGDFSVEYDNYIEMDLKSLTFDQMNDDDEDQLEQELKLTVISVYLDCLRERHKRKRMVKKYGLINLQKVFLAYRRYDRTIGSWADRLRCFMPLMEPMEFDLYLESLHYMVELRQDIQRLQEGRSNGLTSLRQVRVFSDLKRRREESMKSNSLNEILNNLQDEDACQQWLQKQAGVESMSEGLPAVLPTQFRKTAPPLEIEGLPGYEKLSPRERKVCATIRLVPEAYLEFKSVLSIECKKHGSLRLAQARSLIKIDVNKTRKLYDFLLLEGYINKD